MKTNFCYQNGYLYEHHGAWHVRYRQRISQKGGSSELKHVSKHLGRSKDFSNIFEVEQCRASFVQTINRDRLSANSRITLAAFVEGVYLPWAEEERRPSTRKDHHQIWTNHLCDLVGRIRLREFRTVDASRMLRAIAKEKDLAKATLQHIKSVLSTIFTYAKNDGAFDGANPVDDVLIPWDARESRETHAYDLDQLLHPGATSTPRKEPGRDRCLRRAATRGAAWTRVDWLHRHGIDDQSFDLEVGGQPSEDARQPRFCASTSKSWRNTAGLPVVQKQASFFTLAMGFRLTWKKLGGK